MLQPLLDAYEKNLTYAKRLAGDLPNEWICEQPSDGVNHPAWIVGHLALTSDRMAGQRLLGLSPQLPDNWTGLFGPGTVPSSDRTEYPLMEDLLTALRGIHAHLDRAVRGHDPQHMSQPIQDDELAGMFPTVGHGLMQVLVRHEMLHLGQFSQWRRIQGFPAVSLA